MSSNLSSNVDVMGKYFSDYLAQDFPFLTVLGDETINDLEEKYAHQRKLFEVLAIRLRSPFPMQIDEDEKGSVACQADALFQGAVQKIAQEASGRREKMQFRRELANALIEHKDRYLLRTTFSTCSRVSSTFTASLGHSLNSTPSPSPSGYIGQPVRSAEPRVRSSSLLSSDFIGSGYVIMESRKVVKAIERVKGKERLYGPIIDQLSKDAIMALQSWWHGERRDEFVSIKDKEQEKNLKELRKIPLMRSVFQKQITQLLETFPDSHKWAQDIARQLSYIDIGDSGQTLEESANEDFVLAITRFERLLEIFINKLQHFEKSESFPLAIEQVWNKSKARFKGTSVEKESFVLCCADFLKTITKPLSKELPGSEDLARLRLAHLFRACVQDVCVLPLEEMPFIFDTYRRKFKEGRKGRLFVYTFGSGGDVTLVARIAVNLYERESTEPYATLVLVNTLKTHLTTSHKWTSEIMFEVMSNNTSGLKKSIYLPLLKQGFLVSRAITTVSNETTV